MMNLVTRQLRAPTALLRGWTGLLGTLLTLLLLGVLVVGSVHHHSDSASDHACAICSASHAPAVVTATGCAAATTFAASGSVSFRYIAAPTAPRPATARSRAPPVA